MSLITRLKVNISNLVEDTSEKDFSFPFNNNRLDFTDDTMPAVESRLEKLSNPSEP